MEIAIDRLVLGLPIGTHDEEGLGMFTYPSWTAGGWAGGLVVCGWLGFNACARCFTRTYVLIRGGLLAHVGGLGIEHGVDMAVAQREPVYHHPT